MSQGSFLHMLILGVIIRRKDEETCRCSLLRAIEAYRSTILFGRSNSLQLNKNEKRQPIPNAARKPREPSRRDAPRGRKDCVPFPSGLERADIVDVANVVLAETGTAGLN